jgi:hypothetical protein
MDRTLENMIALRDIMRDINAKRFACANRKGNEHDTHHLRIRIQEPPEGARGA